VVEAQSSNPGTSKNTKQKTRAYIVFFISVFFNIVDMCLLFMHVDRDLCTYHLKVSNGLKPAGGLEQIHRCERGNSTSSP
jgi:hypothetical protein